MIIAATPDGLVGRPERALWMTKPFDLPWHEGPPRPRCDRYRGRPEHRGTPEKATSAAPPA